MRLRDLKDVYLGQDIYIVGAGPSVNLFPLGHLKDKICLSLNDTYKMHPAIKPIVIMNNPTYAQEGSRTAPFHENFKNIKYPVAKMTGRYRSWKGVEFGDPDFYCYDWSHKIDTDIWNMTKDTDYLYSSPEGCVLQEALQLAWIMGAKNIFIIGCDSRTMGGKHYANFDKDGFSADEEPKGPLKKTRNYDSYIYGTLIAMEFLKRKGVSVFYLSNLVGYHLVDYQFEVLKGSIPFQSVLDEVKKLPKWDLV
ncbi:MAG: hypothetical protein HYZ87_03245 [Candidatus Omnitrophica bacterium]|nr:hypothetical protein [Candidatus Omnitrophota bacterium]